MLSEILDAISAPRRAILSTLGGEDSGTGILQRHFGADPESMWTKILGGGIDLAADPLTYALPAGAGLFARALGGGARAAEAANLASKFRPFEQAASEMASPTARFLGGESGAVPLGSTAENLGAVSRFRPLHENFASFRDVRPLTGDQAAGIAQGLEEGAARAPGYAITSLEPDAAGPAGWLGKIITRGPFSDVDQALERAVTSAGDRYGVDKLGKPLAGLYNQNEGVATQFLGAADPVTTRRHELVHGLIDAASRTGDMSSLSPLMKLPAKLNQVARGIPEGNALGDALAGYGHLTDELAAHSLENRGLWNQIKGGADFLFKSPSEIMGNDPQRAALREAYARMISKTGRVGGDAYRSLGYLPYGLGAGAAGIGAGAGIEKLFSPNLNSNQQALGSAEGGPGF